MGVFRSAQDLVLKGGGAALKHPPTRKWLVQWLASFGVSVAQFEDMIHAHERNSGILQHYGPDDTLLIDLSDWERFVFESAYHRAVWLAIAGFLNGPPGLGEPN